MAEAEATTKAGVELVDCPKCAARLMILRLRRPVMDSCGFEHYSLKCDSCGVRLAGIIDPFDNKLLLSELDS